METSKKILVYCHVMVTGSALLTFTALFIGIDISALVELDVALVGLCGAAHSFYYWKAKAENLAKHRLKDKITMEVSE